MPEEDSGLINKRSRQKLYGNSFVEKKNRNLVVGSVLQTYYII